MATKKIHVNTHRIRGNIKKSPGDREPPITVREGRKRTYANEIVIHGSARMIYDPDKSLLDCGARLILETEAEVEVIRA